VFQESALKIAARRHEIELRGPLNLRHADSTSMQQQKKWRASLTIGKGCAAHREGKVDNDSHLGRTGRGHLSDRVAPIPFAAMICWCDDNNNHTFALAAVRNRHRMGHRRWSSQANIGHVTLAMWP
jgi:hypothetical protein